MEGSTLCYISGYVAFEETISILEPTGTINNFPSSECTFLTSHVKLSHPLPEFFYLSCLLCCYYKIVEKSCAKCLLQAFQKIYEYSQVEYADENKILR